MKNKNKTTLKSLCSSFMLCIITKLNCNVPIKSNEYLTIFFLSAQNSLAIPLWPLSSVITQRTANPWIFSLFQTTGCVGRSDQLGLKSPFFPIMVPSLNFSRSSWTHPYSNGLKHKIQTTNLTSYLII